MGPQDLPKIKLSHLFLFPSTDFSAVFLTGTIGRGRAIVTMWNHSAPACGAELGQTV